jgi:hypothetical protein
MTSSVFERDLTELSASALRTKYHREANSHRNMLQRVKEQGHDLHPRWREFRSFLSDMGPKPSSEHTLDRVDPRKLAYGPGLCRWADKLQQTQNRQNTVYVDFNGETLSLREFSTRIGKHYQTVYAAIRRGKKPNEIAASKTEKRPADWKHPNPQNEASFWDTYGRWRKKLQPRYKRYEHPALCYLFICYAGWVEAEKTLEAMGLYEVAAEDDAEMARLTSSHAYKARTAAAERVRETLDWIAARNPKLANELRPISSAHMQALGRMFKEATQPPPDGTTTWR